MKILYKPEDETEAIALSSLLEKHSIQSEVQSFRDTAYDGLYQNQHGWGVIRVDESDYDSAATLVSEWKAAIPDSLELNNAPGTVVENEPPAQQAKNPHLKPILISASVILNLLLAYLFFSPKFKAPYDYEIFDSDGSKVGLVEWHDNKTFPYKYISYLKNGKALSVSIDSDDSGRTDKHLYFPGSLKSTYTDLDGDGIAEYLVTDCDSGSKIQYWDADQNGIYERSTITLSNGKTYNMKHNNENGFDLEIKTPSGEMLDFSILKQIAEQL